MTEIRETDYLTLLTELGDLRRTRLSTLVRQPDSSTEVIDRRIHEHETEIRRRDHHNR